jgi:hypothetical protein
MHVGQLCLLWATVLHAVWAAAPGAAAHAALELGASATQGVVPPLEGHFGKRANEIRVRRAQLAAEAKADEAQVMADKAVAERTEHAQALAASATSIGMAALERTKERNRKLVDQVTPLFFLAF